MRLEKLIKEYGDIIGKEGICPICLTKIGKDQVEHIVSHLG